MTGYYDSDDNDPCCCVPSTRPPIPTTRTNSAIQYTNQTLGPYPAKLSYLLQPSRLLFHLTKIPYTGPTQRTGKHLPQHRRNIWCLHGDDYCDAEPKPDAESMQTPLVDCNIVLEDDMYYIRGMFRRMAMPLAQRMEKTIRQFPLWHLATTKNSWLSLVDLADGMFVVKLSRDADAWREHEYHVTAYNHLKLRWDMVKSCVGEHVPRVRVARPGGRVGTPKEGGSSKEPTRKWHFRPDARGFLMEHIGMLPSPYEREDGGLEMVKPMVKLGKLRLERERRVCRSGRMAIYLDEIWNKSIILVNPCAAQMGAVLAIIHWSCLIDARGVEFQIAPCGTNTELWVTDFGDCTSMKLRVGYVKTCLVDAALENSSWPRPRQAFSLRNFDMPEGIADQIWNTFKETYMVVSLNILNNSKQGKLEKSLPATFVNEFERRCIAETHDFDDTDDEDAYDDEDCRQREYDGVADESIGSVNKQDDSANGSDNVVEEPDIVAKKPDDSSDEFDDTFAGLGPIGGMSKETLDEWMDLMEPRKEVLLPPDQCTFGDEDVQMRDADEPVNRHDQPDLMDETPDVEGTLVAKSFISMDHIKEYDPIKSEKDDTKDYDFEYDEYEAAKPTVSRKPASPEWFPMPKRGTSYLINALTTKNSRQLEQELPIDLEDPMEVDQSTSNEADQNVKVEINQDTGDELGQDAMEEIDTLFEADQDAKVEITQDTRDELGQGAMEDIDALFGDDEDMKDGDELDQDAMEEIDALFE